MSSGRSYDESAEEAVFDVRDGLSELHYPFHDMTITVTQCGRLCFGSRKINLSHVFAGQNVGVREVADHVWLISFMHYDIEFFDDETSRVECAPNPFGLKCWWSQWVGETLQLI